MQLQVLGSLQIVQDGQALSPGGPKERRLYAMLVANAGQVVSLSALADVVWDGRPPRSYVKSLQVHVAHLRRLLGDRIRTVAPGYVLAVDRSTVDSLHMTDLVRSARRALDDRPALAETQVCEALGMWRGQPYGELA